MSRYVWEGTHPGIDLIERRIEIQRGKVVSHPIYDYLTTHRAIVTFMEHHIFAVWDFMSLLKSLQQQLTCTAVPWVPTGPVACRRLINDIVLVEESDQLNTGFSSHFELYRAAMTEANADGSRIDEFIELITAQRPVPSALEIASVPASAAAFVTSTMQLIESAPLHCQAAAFAFGREDLIPEMFGHVVHAHEQSKKLGLFIDYLERHIEVDGDEHTPMAMQMLADLCGDDDQKWAECAVAVDAALAARFRFWDEIQAVIVQERESFSRQVPIGV